ncbi:unnamed protein product [Cyprideis torosa]|uniref:S1 motif domain-containing protein n=1 Tax=Cyprideis torosa TaxID=163714 RepID=A0A7R8WIM0_9CRUS|nr:unnamed protein product [Cyprideis torosa]CAG0900948.1 unnamed protein product [Cyprideis torosa]
MSDFLDQEAEESEEEDELTEKEKKKLKKIREESDEEDEEDDEAQIREELADLIDDNPIDEESGSERGSDSPRKGARKRKHEGGEEEGEESNQSDLEEEDYDLLEENLGVKFKRQKKLKRVRTILDESDEEEERGRDDIAQELFDEDDGSRPVEREDSRDDSGSGGRGSALRPGSAIPEEEEEESEDEDDVGDFIVDDKGRPITEGKKKRTRIYENQALQDAQDIFGVAFDYDEFEKSDYEEEDDEEDLDEYEDEEVQERQTSKKLAGARKKRSTKKSIYELYEPSELERGHLTDFDNEIRLQDVPERMQLRAIPVTNVSEGTGAPELDDEADWILKHAFINKTVSSQPLLQERANHQRDTVALRSKIRNALDYMRNQSLEVPFIAFYRKEYVEPELKINDLWTVYHYDEKWCQLKKRKQNLLRLFERMRKYKKYPENPDQYDTSIPQLAFVLDRDIERMKIVESIEELGDTYSHFLLYFHLDLQPMKEAERMQKKEEARERRKKAREEREKAREENEGAEPMEEEEPPPEEEEMDDAANELKRSNKASPYDICLKAGLEGLAKMFGLSPYQFAENVRDNYQRHDVDQVQQDPTEAAQSFIGGKFGTPEEVLRAVKFMMATQLAKEPLVRASVRENFFEMATMDVKPTKRGVQEIDENHPLYPLKYLSKKPIRDIANEMFLRLSTAEEDGLITIQFNTDFKTPTNVVYVEEVKQYFYRDEFSRPVQLWNALRAEVVQLAFDEFIFPALKRELKQKLIQEAKTSLILQIKRRMYDWIKTAPFSINFPEKDAADWGSDNGVRVLSIAYSSEPDIASYACMLDLEGEVGDFLRLPDIMRRKNSWRQAERIGKERDTNRLKSLISSKNPHVIAIAGTNRDAISLKTEVQAIVQSLIEEEEFPAIPVEIVDDTLALIFQNCTRAENDFREYPALLRQAISIGRFMQDPLQEMSVLCSPDEEILGIKFHPLQDLLDKETVLDAIYTEMINRTNEVGVDVNILLNHSWKANILQFVCGLGPRKASALLKTLKQSISRLENRTQLVTSCKMGPKVFINCAGFIKIDTNAVVDSTDMYIEVLDSTRIHPETYEWARKMAVDALEYNGEEGQAGVEEHTALEEIMENPENLKELDLDAFADELERQRLGKKKTTLYDIRAELNHRYKDMRVPYRSPTTEELFQMLTKETTETFYVGKMVLATVAGISHRKPGPDQLDKANPVRDEESGFWQCPFCMKNDFPELSEVWNHFDAGGCPGQATGVRVRLDNGLTGFINMKNLSDKPVTNPEARVKTGQVIHCRVTKIYVDRFHVDCTSKSSALADVEDQYKPQKDPYYDYVTEKDAMEAVAAKKNKKRVQCYTKRVIVHPSFHNITFEEAKRRLASMELGDPIIRPSSRDVDHLTVSWKVAEGVFQHIDVREKGKENAFTLGQSLWIGSEEFEDLDEIIARHIHPMAAHARDILSYKYYKDTDGGKKDVAEKIILEEKAANPNKIHYLLTASKDFPGKFMLSYCPRSKVVHEFVTVTPDGFRYRGQVFESFNNFLRWFKEHFRDPIPSTPRAALSSRTPYTTHTPGGNLNPAATDALKEAARNLPPHFLQSLKSVPTPGGGFNHTPYSTYTAQTPYTPSGQTPYMTPYVSTPGSVSSSNAGRSLSVEASSLKKKSSTGTSNSHRAVDGSAEKTPRSPFTAPSDRRGGQKNRLPRRGYDGTPLYDE